MKIERIFYGMIKGRIILQKTAGVNKLLSDANITYIRNLTVKDSDRYLYFKNEQVIALPKIINVFDEKSKRSWVQNETRLIAVHDYFELTNPSKVLFQNVPFTELTEEPDQFTVIIV
jgi:hypothetical protein